MNTRITHAMTQRNVLADLNAVSNRLARTQSKIASNREIERPSDNPFGTTQAMALRQNLAATQQYQRNSEDAAGWQEATEGALDQITTRRPARTRAARPGLQRLLRPDVARVARRRARADHPGHQAGRQRDLPRQLPARRQRDRHPAV